MTTLGAVVVGISAVSVVFVITALPALFFRAV
jgi:hypothetical protein